MTGYAVDPGGLAASAPAYGGAADQLAAVYDELSCRLQAVGACWGNDDAGQMFAGKYVGPALSALESLRAHGDSMQSMVDGIYSWAKAYVSADDAAKVDLSREIGY